MINYCSFPERNCLDCEYKSQIFHFLTPEELEQIQATKITVMFKKGETIRKQGTYLSHVLSVNSGLAKVCLEGTVQRNAIIRIVKPTNFIGGPGIFLDNLHHYTVTALMDTVVCFIDVSVFKDLLDTNKSFSHEFMKDFSSNILSVYNRLLYLTQKQIPGRMADTLIYLFDEIFESARFTMCLSKQDLADLSGMSKDSAMKVLKDFQHEGIISLQDKQMELLNPAALKRISKVG